MTSLAAVLDWMSVHGWLIAAALIAATAVRDHYTPAQVADRRSYRRLLREDRHRRAAPLPMRAARPQTPVGAVGASVAPTYRHDAEREWASWR